MSTITRDYAKSTSSTWLRVATFEFPGSNAYGTPSKARIIASRSGSSGTAYMRIWDRTNNQEIAQISWSSSSKAFYDDVSLGTIPTGPAIWEVQVRDTGSEGRLHELRIPR